jgi:hypothetical protein
MEKTEVHAIEMVRKIRDEQAALLASKSKEEVVEYFRKAGQRVIEQARQARPNQLSPEEGA